MVKNNHYSGITPDFLNIVEAKSNCRFIYFQVPKNRQEILFENGKAIDSIATDKLAKVFIAELLESINANQK